MAENITLIACGVFFVVGLLAGTWKYIVIRRSPDFKAPRYVSTSHHTALMYSFACLVVLELIRQSTLPEFLEAWIAVMMVGCFAAALGSYLIHGLLGDTDNQLARPHRLGDYTWPNGAISLFMLILIVVETGGFLILLAAAAKQMLTVL